jgi:hypothetical protein
MLWKGDEGSSTFTIETPKRYVYYKDRMVFSIASTLDIYAGTGRAALSVSALQSCFALKPVSMLRKSSILLL